ncbi:hypothetical protein Ndes2437B_g08037 [Nannochloris sp. 'desiccata']
MEDHVRAAIAFLQPDETAAQFLARSFVEQIHTGVPLIDLRAPLRATNVVEISGLASTGKTEILYSIAATCILPNFQNGIAYGGHNSNVLYLDLDCKFDIVRLAEILQSRITAAHTSAGLGHPSSDLISEIVKESVSRLFLISCPSSFHLLAALKIIKPEATRLSRLDGGLAAVLVDNVTAHYYIDRAIKSGGTSGGGVPLMRRVVAGVVVDEHGFDDPSSPGSPGVSLTLGKVHSAMVVGLRNLQHALRVPIIATKHLFSAAGTQGGRGGSSSDTAWAYRDVMLKPWQQFVTHRLVLKKMGGGGAVGSPQRHLAKWIKPEIPVDDKFMVGTVGIVGS